MGANDRHLCLYQGHSRQVSAVAFSPDGRKAVTASQDHSLRVWNLSVRYAQLEDPKIVVNVQQQVLVHMQSVLLA
jgi:WD40 repeat protein